MNHRRGPGRDSRLKFLAVGCVGVMMVCSALAEPASKPPPQSRSVAGLDEVRIEPARRMRGRAFKWDHEIQIALPPSYGKTNRSYPVLWLTDGPWYFELAVKAVHFDLKQHVPEMIVVAVGPPPEELKAMVYRRTYEFLPSAMRGFKGFGASLLDLHLAMLEKQAQADGRPVPQGGGAAHFLAFLMDEVRVALSRDYRMADDHTLFGDSGGGIFCTYVLLTQPAAFSKYICGSPNLAMDDFELFRMEERYAKAHKDMKATVFFGAGEAEMSDPNDRITAWGVLSSTARMVEILRLRKYPSLKLSARIFPDEDHASVPPLNLSSGLRAVWQDETPDGVP